MYNSNSDEAESTSNSYKTILPKYRSNKQLLLRDGFNQLKQDMGFTQIRFYCFQKLVGRVFHIMTNNDVQGANVVAYFTTSNAMPVACGSFTRLPDDNSSLAVNCDKWGLPTSNRWGSRSFRTDDRLFKRPLIWSENAYFRTNGAVPYKCDGRKTEMSIGDTWRIFVR